MKKEEARESDGKRIACSVTIGQIILDISRTPYLNRSKSGILKMEQLISRTISHTYIYVLYMSETIICAVVSLTSLVAAFRLSPSQIVKCRELYL